MDWLRITGILDWIIRIGPVLVFAGIVAWVSANEEKEDEHKEV